MMSVRFAYLSGLLGVVCVGLIKAQAQEPLPQISFTPGAAHTWNADWQGVAGRTYFSQWSTDLETWKYAPLMEFGAGAKSFGMATNGLPKFFMRLNHVDDFNITDLATAKSADFDRDLLTNWQEVSAYSTDPLNRDTDGDTLPDGWEVTHGLSPLDNGSINPANGIDGIFPGSTSTNGFAYINLPNVQNYNGGTLENFDGDLAPNDQDSDPTDRVVDWPPVAATSYAVIPLGHLDPDLRGVSINSSGVILTSYPCTNITIYNIIQSRTRIWKNGIWSSSIPVPVDMLTFSGPYFSNTYNCEALASYHYYESFFGGSEPAKLCGRYMYSFVECSKQMDCGPTQGNWLDRQFRRDTHLISVSAPTKIFEFSPNISVSPFPDLIYIPGNQRALHHSMNSDGSMAKVQRIKGVNGAPDISQTSIWFPPSYDPTSSYIPGEGSASLQLPNNYGVLSLDASGAAVVTKPQLPGSTSTEYVLYDQGIQSPLPSDIAYGFRKPVHSSSGSYIIGDGSMLNRITFGAYNEHSRLLVGGKYVKKGTGINQRQKSPFTDAFTNSSYEYKGTVSSVASNGLMMGSYTSKLITPSNSPTSTHQAIWRDGKTIPLVEVVEPPISWSPGQQLPSPPRYSNVIGHAMNDSGMIVVSADDAQNPIPPDANGNIKKSLLLNLPVDIHYVDRDVMKNQWAQKKPFLTPKREIYAGPNSGDMIEWRISAGSILENQTTTWKAEHLESGEIIPGPSGINLNFWRIANEGWNDVNGDQWLKWKPGNYRITCSIFGIEREIQRIRVGYRSDQILVIGQIVQTFTHSVDEPTGAALGTWADAIADDLSGTLSTATGMLPSIVEDEVYSTIRPKIPTLPTKAAEAWMGVWSGGIPGIAAPVLPPLSRGPAATSYGLNARGPVGTITAPQRYWMIQHLLNTNSDTPVLPDVLPTSPATQPDGKSLPEIFSNKQYRFLQRFQARFLVDSEGKIEKPAARVFPHIADVGPTKLKGGLVTGELGSIVGFQLPWNDWLIDLPTEPAEASSYNGEINYSADGKSMSGYASARIGLKGQQASYRLFGKDAPWIFSEVILHLDPQGEVQLRGRTSTTVQWDYDTSITTAAVVRRRSPNAPASTPGIAIFNNLNIYTRSTINQFVRLRGGLFEMEGHLKSFVESASGAWPEPPIAPTTR